VEFGLVRPVHDSRNRSHGRRFLKILGHGEEQVGRAERVRVDVDGQSVDESAAQQERRNSRSFG
jgi:hypothetical protein